MEKNSDNLLARIRFSADSMLPRMKKCIDKYKTLVSLRYPAIEMSTGIMIASDGHILSAHKLSDYVFTPSDGALMGDIIMLPVDVLSLKGSIEVTLHSDSHESVVTVTDEKGSSFELYQEKPYPGWRTVFPGMTGYAVSVDHKAWDAALKDIIPNLTSSVYPVMISLREKSNTLSLQWANYDTDSSGLKNVNASEVPFEVHVSLNAKYLRSVMAFRPTSMRFIDNTRPVLFYNDETICLLMPLLVDEMGSSCRVDNRYCERFDLTSWIGADLGEILVDNRNLSLADKLREALLKMKKAA